MPAGNVYAAPVGTPLGSADWKLVGHTTDGVTMTEPFALNSDEAHLRFDSIREWPKSVTIPSGGWQRSDLWPDETLDRVNMIALQRRINKAAYDYSMPSRWLMGCEYPNINERSKPMGLTKSHNYTDNDGDTLTIDENDADDEATGWISHMSEAGFNITTENSVPLALNMLGYDRPYSGGRVPVLTVGEYEADGEKYAPANKWERDKNVAWAISYLLGADIFDQREASKKAEAEAQAKRDAEYARHKQLSFDRAKQGYADAIRDQIATGINAESAAKVQAALSAFETARRKLEGLPS